MAARTINIALAEEPNRSWKVFNDNDLLTQRRNPILTEDSVIFTMGSCFAVEIRKLLRSLEFPVRPDYRAIEFDPERVRIGNLPERENLNHYHTFAIRQEFERCAGLWRQERDDYWRVQDRWFGGEVAYQDPYRRAVYGRTPDDLFEAIDRIDAMVNEGFATADVFLITLGLTEVWRKTNDGRFSCMNPGYAGGGGHAETVFHRSTFRENRDNLARTVELIRRVNPAASIVFTVSPVPLGATFTDNDVTIANMESKSILRTAAAEIARENESVGYFPSYEIAVLGQDVFLDDGRHVRPDVVQAIVKLFVAQHQAPQPAPVG